MTESMPEPEAASQLDFTGARLIAREELEAAPDVSAEEILTAHCFGDAAVLLPSTGAARRILLETIRTRHRVAGRPKRRRLLVLSGEEPLPAEFAADVDVEAVPDDPGAVRAAIDPRTAGLLVAPLRVGPGLQMPYGSVLAELREMADEYGLALVFDETEGGLGRTGMAFAHEWTGVAPDLMLVGEDAGLPVASLALSEKYARALPRERPAVAEADRDRARDMLAFLLADGFEARIQALGWQMEDGLARLRYGRPDLFADHLGQGLMQGLVCKEPAADIAARLAGEGLTVRALGNVLAFLPPLDTEEEEIATAMARLEQVVARMVEEGAPVI